MTDSFHLLSQADVPELLSLLNMAEPGSVSFTVERTEAYVNRPNRRFFGIRRNGMLTAAIGVTGHHFFIHGRPQMVYYLHDLRVRDNQRIAFGRLVKELVQELNKETDYVFSIVIGENPNIHSVTGGTTLFPRAFEFGRITHMGFPLFMGKRKEGSVREITAGEAWKHYSRLAAKKQFAPADEERFHMGEGICLGAYHNQELVATAKVVDHAFERMIVRNTPLTFRENMLNAWLTFRGKKTIPGEGEIFSHLYLSYFIQTGPNNRLAELLNWVRKYYAQDYPFIFTGMLPNQAKPYINGSVIHFESRVFGYGRNPQIAFEFPELTII